jgi:cytochrome c556
MRYAPAVIALALLAACAPHKNLTVAQIAGAANLQEVMDVQATVADPQWSKINHTGYTDADWAALGDMAARILATSEKAKQFSKGPMFDDFALRLHTHADELQAAFQARNETGASTALAAMKATCKECHNRFK